VPALLLTTGATVLVARTGCELVLLAEAVLSSTGTSFSLTPEEQAASAAVRAKIQKLRLIIKTPKDLID
jgi:hypothetical protein